jgi:methionine-S-sulfoxide reductase
MSSASPLPGGRTPMRANPLPVLNYGNQAGGGTVHYGAVSWRLHEDDFRARSHTIERYGALAIPQDSSLADWPLSYADLEPYCGAAASRRDRVARLPVGGGERALNPAAGDRRTGEPAGDIRGRGTRRRLLLGRPGRVPACRGRHQRRLRLCRGAANTAHYEMVGTNRTGHAESVRITFDPRLISYGHILQIYFSVAHDPTELNRQGPDVGTQYRSTIFPTNSEQTQVAEAYIAQLNQAHVFNAPIVTKIELSRVFYPAEDYHQDFLTRNPTYPYIVVNDLPKIEVLKSLFPDLYRATPVLFAAAASRN